MNTSTVTEYRSVFEGIDRYYKEAYIEKRRPCPRVADCTRPSRNNSTESNKTARDGKLPARFYEAIQLTSLNVQKARRGLSVLDQGKFKASLSQKTLPFFDQKPIKQEL